ENVYVIETEVGNIKFKVYPKKAPISVANFLRYVELADFDSSNFHRVVRMDNQPKDSIRIEVIQGTFTASGNSFGPIPHETTNKIGLLHKDGTVSMARREPGSASTHFFICINDQPELDYGGKRNPDGQGFAAFGQVIEGMEVIRNIQDGETEHQALKRKVKIIKIRREK
ncbi:MAG: peptidylprolyl isomerase, partial [Cyclobacteriaceae bacterium]